MTDTAAKIWQSIYWIMDQTFCVIVIHNQIRNFDKFKYAAIFFFLTINEIFDKLFFYSKFDPRYCDTIVGVKLIIVIILLPKNLYRVLG